MRSNQIDIGVNCKSIKIKYKCHKCSSEVLSESLFLPKPYMTAEKMSDSYNYDSEYIYCPKCGDEVEVTVCMGIAGGYVDVTNLGDGLISVSSQDFEYYDEFVDDILYDSGNIINQFRESMGALRRLLDIEVSEELTQIMYRQLYISAIGCMEDCLMSTLVSKVLDESDDTVMKRFVKKYKKFRDEKFSINNIYDEFDALREKVKVELIGIIYHNLPTVKEVYREILNIELKDISQLSKIIQARHHMVHRNGKDKDGNLIKLSKKEVIHVFTEVESFIYHMQLSIDEGRE
jgi:hypothetical protein